MSMNLFNIKKEISNLNNLVNELKIENNHLKSQLNNLNDELLDIKIKKPSELEVINFIDELKEDMIILDEKIELINKKRFFKEIIELEKKDEAQKFLEEMNIDTKIINILLFLNYNTISDLCQINIEDLLIYNIEKSIIENIIKNACEKLSLNF